MYACVCVSRARAFRPCWPCRLSVCVCVCVWVRGCASFFGAQKAQRTLKDTWPALTATPTTAARQRDSDCVHVCVYAWRTRCLGLSSSSSSSAALPCALPLQAALALALTATAVFCCQLAMHSCCAATVGSAACSAAQYKYVRQTIEVRKL